MIVNTITTLKKDPFDVKVTSIIINSCTITRFSVMALKGIVLGIRFEFNKAVIARTHEQLFGTWIKDQKLQFSN